MAAGLLICAIVLCICTVVVLFTVRGDIKNQEMAERQRKRKNK
jgi:hypothetical protein